MREPLRAVYLAQRDAGALNGPRHGGGGKAAIIDYKMQLRFVGFSLLWGCWSARVSFFSAQSPPNDARAREIFKELIEINTTDSAGN